MSGFELDLSHVIGGTLLAFGYFVLLAYLPALCSGIASMWSDE